MRPMCCFLASLTLFALSGATGAADATYKIGIPVGLSGYASVTDHAWRDGIALAVEAINAKGGLNGRKVELVIEDNHSQPQDAVIAYKKMISSDHVQIFDSGCVTAGNFAAASNLVQQKIPNMTCGVLPPNPAQRAWMFGMRLPARFELEVRFAYLRDHTRIRKIGVLYDATPYSQMQKDLAVKVAQEFKIEVIDTQVYNQDDADLSIQIGHIASSGGGAILKVGMGGSTVTAAKNIAQLGLDIPLFGSSDDLIVFRAAADALGDRFFFVAETPQFIDALPRGPARDATEAFLKQWNAKYPGRDGSVAAHAWDSVMLIAKAVDIAKSVEGATVRDALQQLPPYQGAAALYHFTPDTHEVTVNPLALAHIRNGKVVLAQ
jgi:branched-chain amino acid transport system substrate-binding protein